MRVRCATAHTCIEPVRSGFLVSSLFEMVGYCRILCLIFEINLKLHFNAPCYGRALGPANAPAVFAR